MRRSPIESIESLAVLAWHALMTHKESEYENPERLAEAAVKHAQAMYAQISKLEESIND